MLTHVLNPFLCKYLSESILSSNLAELGSKFLLNFSFKDTNVIPYSLLLLKPFLLPSSLGKIPSKAMALNHLPKVIRSALKSKKAQKAPRQSMS